MAPPDPLKELSTLLSQLRTSEEKTAATNTFLRRFDAPLPYRQLNSQGGHTSQGDQSPPFSQSVFYSVLNKHGVDTNELFKLSRTMGFALDEAPCAFIDITRNAECKEVGRKICGECRLVQYCSSVCS